MEKEPWGQVVHSSVFGKTGLIKISEDGHTLPSAPAFI